MLLSSLTSKTSTKNNLKKKFLLIKVLFKGTFTSFFKDKKSKKSQSSRNQGFSNYFCLMIEGSGSVALTNRSGSRRPKNMPYGSGSATLLGPQPCLSYLCPWRRRDGRGGTRLACPRVTCRERCSASCASAATPPRQTTPAPSIGRKKHFQHHL